MMNLKPLYLHTSIFLILIQLSFSIIFVGLDQSRIDADVVQNLTLNVYSSDIQLNDGNLLCSGLPISINITFDANYTLLTTRMVPCPTFGCGPRPNVPNSTSPFSIILVNKTSFLNNISFYYNTQFYQNENLAGSGPFPRFNSTGTYYNPPPDGSKSPDASFGHRMFCYGNVSIYKDNLLLNSSNLNSSFFYMFTPSEIGNVFINSSFLNCSIFVRTWETDGPIKDSTFIPLSFSIVTQKTNISIINGPSLNVTSQPRIYVSVPGGNVTFRLMLNNTGDMNATITGISLSDGFIVNSYTPSTINRGENLELFIYATAPNANSGTILYPTANISYSSTLSVVGTCGSNSQTDIIIGNVTIGNLEPIDVDISVRPSGIFNEGNLYSPNKINITATIERDDYSIYGLEYVESNITIFFYNTTLASFRHFANVSIIGSSGTAFDGKGSRYDWKITGSQLVINSTQNSSNFVPGVYRIVMNSYDELGPENDKTDSDFTYFVVFTAPGCIRKV